MGVTRLPNDPSWKYAAFVSYRHLPEDRRYAEWLIDALERFETPEPLVQKGARRKLGVIFRDDNELGASSDLTDSIRQALWHSHHLIVVCSSATPQSLWVRAEVKLFQTWGRSDNILVLLIDGDAKTCCPPELLRWQTVGEGPATRLELAEPVGASLMPVQGKSPLDIEELARDKAACRLLGCELGELRDRIRERRERQLSRRYFDDFIRRWCIPEGVGELTEVQVRRRIVSYEFEFRGGVVEVIRRVNGHLRLEPTRDGVAQWDITYRSDGVHPEAICRRDRLGRVKLIETFSRDLTVADFLREDNSAYVSPALSGPLAQHAREVETLGSRRSDIARHRLEYDARGRVTRRFFARDNRNAPARDAHGNYGEAKEYDERGLTSLTYCLDAEGSRAVQSTGVACRKLLHDSAGRLSSATFLDANDYAIRGVDWYSTVTWTYDDFGNVVETAFFDEQGTPCLSKEGVARTTMTYGPNGEGVEIATYDDVGRRAVDRSTGASRIVYQYWDTRWCGRELFDADDRPTVGVDGYWAVRAAVDDLDRPVEEQYFDIGGRPTNCNQGYARITRSFDSAGNTVEEVFYDSLGRRTLCREGYARASQRFDSRGYCVEFAYFDENDQPTQSLAGWHSWKARFDTRGNIVEHAFFGKDGRLTLNDDEVARIVREYDVGGNLVEEAYFGSEGQPVLHKRGVARECWRYDGSGRMVEVSCFGTDNKPTLNDLGWATLTQAYDGRGNVREERYFGKDGQPILKRLGMAGWIASHDSRGNTVHITYIGCDGALIMAEGYAQNTFRYDDRGNCVEKVYLGTAGERVARPEFGYASMSGKHDARGKPTEMAVFDVEGRPTTSHQIFRAVYRRNARGALVEEHAFGTDGMPTLTDDGYSRTCIRHDARGNVIEELLFGVNGEPVLCTDGYSVRQLSYDARDRALTIKLLGVRGEPVDNIDGYHRAEQTFDEVGSPKDKIYFNVAGDRVTVTDHSVWSIASDPEYRP